MKALPLVLLLVSSCATAEIYRWVDKDGKVHYSDKPQTSGNSEKITPKQPSTVTLVAPKPSSNTSPTPPALASDPYRIDFSNPSDGATVRDNDGQLQLGIVVEPPLASHHRVQLLLDGKLVRTLGGGGSFALDNLDRGEHKLQAKVIDKSGKVLASSPQRTVYLHRHSQLFPSGPKAPSGN